MKNKHYEEFLNKLTADFRAVSSLLLALLGSDELQGILQDIINENSDENTSAE